MRRNLLFLSSLLLITLATLWPVGRLGFTGYDDYDYIFQNPNVQSGLNWDSILWALTSTSVGVWHPLTWLSHMLDCQFFGLNPGEEHWVNLGFHTANTLLLFVLLQQLTGARWRSFLVAAWFAIHPLHVQSVAWISERKDVLSGFFGLVTLLIYVRYCRGKTSSLHPLVIFAYALGLMAKPMLVTLPIIMLLLDFWPLGRLAATSADPSQSKRSQWFRQWWPLLIEKIPLFLLGLASCLIAVFAEKSTNTVVSTQAMSLPDRGINVVVSYCLYLEKLFWPANLAIFYPLPGGRPGALVFIGALCLLILVTLACIWRRRCQPWLLVGWLWFLIMLLPVIGLVQIGLQAMADRYTYLPAIGLFIIAAWGLAEIAGNSRRWQTSMAVFSAITLAACSLDTRHQLGFWRDDATLFKHVVEVTPENNGMGYFYLGISYAQIGNLDAAASNLELALKATPEFALARSRLGNILLLQKKYPAAETQFRELVKSHPENVAAHMALGFALSGQEKDTAARAEYLAAIQLQPGDATISEILAANTRRVDAGLNLTNWTDQLKTNDTPEIHAQIATAQNILGHYRAAAEQYQMALNQTADSPEILNNFAWLLATCPDPATRDGKHAVQFAEQACRLTQFKKTIFLGTLAAAYAEARRFEDAITTAQKACDNAAALGEADLLGSNQELLRLYQKHRAYHQPADKPQ